MSHSEKLGTWAVIDIETTGVDPSYDQIIDVGFLQFKGLKCINRFSSLVHFDGELSSFIQKLTGIKKEMLLKAPPFKEVEVDLSELEGNFLIAHNSDFEMGFLKKSFDRFNQKSSSESGRETFVDSLYFLAILFPEYSSLKLDFFIREWGIRSEEVHRGFEDALDLLKVILTAAYLTKTDRHFFPFLSMQIQEKKLQDFFLFHFLFLSTSELKACGEEIDFDVEQTASLAREKLSLRRRFLTQKNRESKEVVAKTHLLEFNGESIKKIFNDEAHLKQKFPSYKTRPAQVEMALKVGQSFKNNVHSMIQAPTGTGKTFSYLIPAVLFSLKEGKQVLISTGTKTLQRQAFEKDVPKVLEFLNLSESDLKVALLVGSQNHFCEALFRKDEADQYLDFTSLQNSMIGDHFALNFARLYFEVLFFYNQKSAYNDMLTREDLSFVMKKKIPELALKEKDYRAHFRSCQGHKCPYKNDCSYFEGLKEAKSADIILGNHSLMFNFPRAINRPMHVIVDEAHKIEEEATSQFKLELMEADFLHTLTQLQNMQGVGPLFYLLAKMEKEVGASTPKIKFLREEVLKVFQILSDHYAPLKETLALYFKKSPRYSEQFRNELPFPHKKTHQDTWALKILNHFESIHFVLKTFVQLLEKETMSLDFEEMKSEEMILAQTRFESFYTQLAEQVASLDKLFDEDQNYSRGLTFLESEGFSARSTPIDIGMIVKQELLDPSMSVVYTSATLANENGDTGARGMEWMLGHTYLPPEKRFKQGLFLKSTYDYKNKTKVYLCDDTLPIYQQDFVPSVFGKIKKLIYKLNGRSLLLFSAKSRFEIARELLLKEFDGKIPLFVQGMGQDVVESFKQSSSGILIGMESFGEGIDIPGDKLQFVFIDKIPDLRQDLVINDRRQFFEAQLGNEFTDYYLGHRTRSLHQKLGRLLRTETDYGGVIIVDERIKKWKGNTMEKMMNLMRPYDIHRATLDEAIAGVEEFILKENGA